jgi:hypothetical protein
VFHPNLGNNILDESGSESDTDSSGDGGDSYDAWEHICDDAFDGGRGFVCLVTAYFDAAYNQPKGSTINDPRIHTVSAYIAEKSDWRKLRKEWRKELLAYDVPHFHMKVFEHARKVKQFGTGRISSKSPYQGWTLEKFDLFERRLHRIINRKRPNGEPRISAITSHVVVADYYKTIPDDLKDHPACRSPFILNISNLMEGVANWAHSHLYYDKPIHYIFSGGDDDVGDLDKWFNRCFKRDLLINHFRLGKGFTRIGYDIQWMKSEPALQMVDCPAYELNKMQIEWAKNDFEPMLKSKLRKSLSSLCKIDHFGVTLMESELLRYYADLRASDKRLGF